MLSDKDKKVFTAFSDRVRGRFPGARVWAFGSRVMGIETKETDNVA